MQRLAGLPPHPSPSPCAYISTFLGIYCVSVCLLPPSPPPSGCSEPRVNALVTSFAISHHKAEPTAPNHPSRTQLLSIGTNTGRQSTPFRGSHSSCVHLEGRSPSLGQLRAQQMMTCRHCSLPVLSQPSQHRKGAAVVMEALLCTELIAVQPRMGPFVQRVKAEAAPAEILNRVCIDF